MLRLYRQSHLCIAAATAITFFPQAELSARELSSLPPAFFFFLFISWISLFYFCVMTSKVKCYAIADREICHPDYSSGKDWLPSYEDHSHQRAAVSSFTVLATKNHLTHAHALPGAADLQGLEWVGRNMETQATQSNARQL